MIEAPRGFIEVGSHCRYKHGQLTAGDTFLSRRVENGERIISVLSDGLGSGVKANVLSTLTATVAVNCMERNVPIERTARIIMETLPVCRTRHIRYATFTIVDIDRDGTARIIEYDNLPYVWLRGGEIVEPSRTTVEVEQSFGPPARLHFSQITVELGDRIVFFSDGISQAGLGSGAHPRGWGDAGVRATLESTVARYPEISARRLARRLVTAGARKDGEKAGDDITCGVTYFREPRRLLVATGPPVDARMDAELAERISTFEGRRIIAGGTTGTIVARELGATTSISLSTLEPENPPHAHMEGVEMITEGIITLARVGEYLENRTPPEQLPRNAAALMVEHLLESDSIEFVVGTRVNQAHQDPSVPVHLELRRTQVQRVSDLLRRRYLKDVSVSYL